MLVNELAEYSEPDEDNPLREALLPEQERHKTALPSALPHRKAVLFCPVPGQVRHLKWWLMKDFVDHVDIMHMYAEMGNDEHTEMQLEFHDSHNHSVFVMTTKVGGTSLNLTTANHAVITEKVWVINNQRQAFARVIRLGQNRVPHTWLLNTGPGGYDNYVSDLHHLSGVAQMKVLYSLMSRSNITTSMIYWILESPENHTKWLTENDDTFHSDELSSLIFKNASSRDASLAIQPT